MSFSSFEAGHGSSAGAAEYPLRTLLRDLLEREVQRELEAWLDRAEWQSGPSDQTGDELVDWLRSDDSPLLLHNVEDFVLDPEEHLRSLAARVEGPNHAPRLSVEELASGVARDRAEELRARLRTVAELDAERILSTPRRRGTPKGETRTHYMWLVSPDRDISNSPLKNLVREIIQRRWPGAMATGYIHRDTDNTHIHIWLSAETLSGKKISVTRAAPSGDAILDRYPDIDEEVARSVSRHFNDPAIYDGHIARKLEWVHWRERFEESLRRGERPPVMPHRARHDYDWVGQRRAVSDREGDESRTHSGEREKAAPVPRTKSLMGALELWGKTLYLEARVSYRRELLDSLDVWRDGIDYPIDDVKQHLERRLAETERDYERHREAFERTRENRARKEYPELKYPLHNSKQVAQMEEIARLTRDAELLRHVRSYTDLDRPTDSKGQFLEVGLRWRDLVEARLEVLERADLLVLVAGQRGVSSAMPQARDVSDAGRFSFNRDREIVRGWLDGGWTTERMCGSLPCFETEAVRLHAARYLKAREYFMAAGETLAEWREEGVRFAARPALEESHLDRIAHLVSGEGARVGERERALLLDLAASAGSERNVSLRETTRLLESSLTVDARREVKFNRPSGERGDPEIFRPHEDDWARRLAGLLTLRETEALALAVGGDSREKYEKVREDIFAKRDLLELTRTIRTALGMASVAPAGTYDIAEARALEGYRHVITDGLLTHGESWEEWRATGVDEYKLILPEREQKRAGRIVEEVKARLETERRTGVLNRLEPQLESAAQFYVRAAYRDEGLIAMSEPARLHEYARGLAERFSQVARDAGHEPGHLGLDGRELEVRAESALSDALARIGREERETRELGRLEGRMILAYALRDEARVRQQRFADHAPFHDWSYETLDGHGHTSLCEIWFAYHEQVDPSALLVARDAEQHVERSINEVYARLTAVEVRHAGEARAATRAYEERAEELIHRGITPRGPVFEPDELKRLEEAAVITRDHELIGLVARCEQETYGPEYAAARAMGRALRATVVVHAEHGIPEKFEHPIAVGRLERLPEPVRESLSELLARHRAAREAERGAALSFREGLESQASERAGKVSREMRQGAIRPLLTEVEAVEVHGMVLTMNTHERRSWGQKTMSAAVAVGGDKSRQTAPPLLHEWARRSMSAGGRGSEYERGVVGNTMVLSHREARAIVRQQKQELRRDGPAPSRGR